MPDPIRHLAKTIIVRIATAIDCSIIRTPER